MNQLSIPSSFYFNFATLEACCEPTTILFLIHRTESPWTAVAVMVHDRRDLGIDPTKGIHQHIKQWNWANLLEGSTSTYVFVYFGSSR